MPQIHELITNVMAEIGPIGKNSRNPQQGYKFRGIDDILTAINGPLIKHGISIAPEVIDQKREERQTKAGNPLITAILTIRFTFHAPDGSSIQAVTVGEAMDTGDKASNKAMSAALKYALIHTFCIATGEPIDTENDSPEPAGVAAPRSPPPTDATF